MPAARRLLPVGLLAALVASLGVLNWKLADLPVDISPLTEVATAVEATKPAAGEAPADAPRRSLAELSETVSRPLFHPTRRPVFVRPAAPAEPEVAKAPEPLPEPAAQPSRLSLVGVMGTGAKGRRALIRAEGQTYGTWIDAGGEIEGWRLSAIEDNRVLIEKSGGKEVLLLHAPAAGR